jgi:uncharacterized membrane protein
VAPFELQDVPWSFLMAFASLGLIFFLFRRRADLFRDVGFSGREVALLTLGSIAGWAVNIPLAVYGGSYLMVNVGGTLVPLMLVAWWLRTRKVNLLWLLLGTALVTLAAWRIVTFDPDNGIVARYPDFFLPVAVALVFALAVSFRDLARGAPLAYACGTLGALIGADLMHVNEIAQHFQTAPENTIISIGGAGVFDMVFLAGAFAMTLHLAAVVGVRRKPTLPPQTPDYPHAPITLRDSRRVHESLLRVPAPNPLERALGGLAVSNLALKEGQFDRSVRMSWTAVEALLSEQAIADYVGNGVPEAMRHDLAALRDKGEAARREEGATLQDAGEANTTAKMLVAALAPRTLLTHQLEGVA